MDNSLLESVRINSGGKTTSWVDIRSGRLFLRDFLTGRVSSAYVADYLSFAQRLQDGSFLFAAGQQIGRFRDGRVVELSEKLIESNRRFNDGCIDSAGRLVIGTMNLNTTDHRNMLFCFENDGSVTTLDNKVGLSNGLTAIPVSGNLVSVDSASGTLYVWRLQFDQSYGKKEVFHRFPKETPDGISCSAAGTVAVALWGSSSIAYLTPSGEEIDRWTIPRKFVTSLAFCPATGDLLVAAASEQSLSETSIGESGGIWRLKVNISGVTGNEWQPYALSGIDPGAI